MIEPIRRSVRVTCDPATAFRVFTAEMDTWWPSHIHSRASTEHEDESLTVASIVIEGRAGGRIYETMSDGAQAEWGSVVVWDPPARLVIAWQPNAGPPNPTELELRFIAEGSGTRVDLEHRGWERLGADAAEARDTYAQGWPLTFDQLFAEAANAAQ
ncbi:MAG: SRPBCC family protein [Actinomycetota bacterium]